LIFAQPEFVNGFEAPKWQCPAWPRIGDQLLDQLRALARRDHPAHNIAAEDIKDDVQVKAGPFHRPLDLLHGSEFFDRGLQGHCGFWSNCL